MLMSFYIFPSGLEFDLDNINKNLGKKIKFFLCNSIILIGMKTLLLEWCVVFSSRKQKKLLQKKLLFDYMGIQESHTFYEAHNTILNTPPFFSFVIQYISIQKR